MISPKDLASIRVRFAEAPRGTRHRYLGGCRCVPSRAANSRYSANGRHRAGDWRGLVPATLVLGHTQKLGRPGRDRLQSNCCRHRSRQIDLGNDPLREADRDEDRGYGECPGLRHFLKVRGSIEGDSEMRSVSAGLLKTLRAERPNLFRDFSMQTMRDGTPIVLHSDLVSGQLPQ